MTRLELVNTIIGPWARYVFMLFSGLWFLTKSNHFIIRNTFNSENALNVSLTWEITKNIRLYSFTLNNYIIIFILLLYNYNYIQLQKYKFSLICKWDLKSSFSSIYSCLKIIAACSVCYTVLRFVRAGTNILAMLD